MRRWIAFAARLYPRNWRERYGEEFDALLDDATADGRQLLNVAQGAIIMQFTNRLAYLKVVGALCLAGALLAMASLYPLPPRYVSSAVLRVTPVVDAGQTTSRDVLQRETDDRIERLGHELTGRDNILRILQEPTLNLYPAERERLTLEDIAEQMHNDEDLQILPVGTPDKNSEAFRVSFAYPDRWKAQAVVDELVTMLRARNDAIDQEYAANWKALWSSPIPFRDSLELAEPANIPTRLPVLFRVALGTAGGLLVGMLVLLFWRRPRLGLRMAACGLAGCAVAGALSFLISEQHTSRAVLRLTAPLEPAKLSGALAAPSLNDRLPKLRSEVLEGDKFWAVLRRPDLGFDEATLASLYRNRESAFGIRMLNSGPRAAGTSFEIAFGHRDKYIARSVVVELVSEIENRYVMDLQSMDARADEQIRFAHLHRAGEVLEIVVQPSLADRITTHYRLQLTVAGAVMGILLAVARWSADSHPTYRTSINGEPSLSS